MTYRELLEQYKKNKLSEEQMKEIEQDIEKQEAISEYLIEWEDQDEDYIVQEKQNILDNKESKKADEFTKLVNRKIRKAFLKLGAVVTVVTVIAVLGIVFVLPNIVDRFYYDPGKEITMNHNQLGVDMLVYTDLNHPLQRRESVWVDDDGYGVYDIRIAAGGLDDIVGEIERNQLKIYNENVIMKPTFDPFVWFISENGSDSTKLTEVAAGESFLVSEGFNNAKKQALQHLNEGETYIGYVTLNQMMPYEEFGDFIRSIDLYKDKIWCAVKTNEWENGSFMPANLGFQCMDYGEFEWDNAYVSLKEDGWAFSEEYNEYVEHVGTEKSAQRHFTNMLNYMAKQDVFIEMMGEDPENYLDAAKYVEENGVKVYGFATILDKETALRFSELEEIYCIQTVQRNYRNWNW